jgi:uncharacterized protein
MLLRDAVHDLVTFEAEEERVVPELLATAEMQRLRRIKQLGVTHLVFPGAEHSRFTHAIGAAHVMTRLIRRLRSLHDELPFWQRLASDRARDALAAALLHDVGHGPYSHLFEQAIAGAPHHESWSLKIVREPGTEVHKMLIAIDPGLPERVASLISGGEDPGPYPLPYLAHAVSGTFDVDRCDYLLRDAHMTGVRYGLFDLDWLLRSLRFSPQNDGAPPRFAIDGLKGLPAIEGFVLARRFMFEQVYLHKATRAAEVLIKAIFARAAMLIRDGSRLDPLPRALELAAHGEEIPLGAYLELDDVTIGAAFGSWCNNKDPVLADLCRRLLVRRIGKTLELTGDNASRDRADDLVSRARELTVAVGLDPDAHVALDVAEDVQSFGDPETEPNGAPSPAPHHEPPLDVVLSDGRARPLGAVSVLLARLDNVPIRRIRLVVPPEIRDEMVAILGGGRDGSGVP